MSYALANALAKNCRVLFISHLKIDRDLKLLNPNLEVLNWPSDKFYSLRSLFWLLKLLFKFKPDTVLGHFRAGILVGFMAKLTTFFRVINIQYYHTNFHTNLKDEDLNKFKIKLLVLKYKIIYNFFCDLVICPSEFSRKNIQKFFNVNNVKVIHNGLFDYYVENEKTNDLIKVGFLGRFDENKGVFLLIKAYKEYIKFFPNSKIKLHIAGYGSKDNLLKVNKLIEETNIANCGYLNYEKVVDFFSNLNYSIIPSNIDNLPTTAIESLMQGTPIAISKNNGLAELIQDNKNSFVINHSEESIIEWFKKIENFNEYSEMSNMARQLYLKYFFVNDNVDKMTKIILNL